MGVLFLIPLNGCLGLFYGLGVAPTAFSRGLVGLHCLYGLQML
jgi:hypothetical protein